MHVSRTYCHKDLYRAIKVGKLVPLDLPFIASITEEKLFFMIFFPVAT